MGVELGDDFYPSGNRLFDEPSCEVVEPFDVEHGRQRKTRRIGRDEAIEAFKRFSFEECGREG